MATERIEIIIEGKNRASGALSGLQSGLGGIASVAGGILAAGIFSKIGEGIAGLGKTAIDSVGELQALEIGLTSLIARQKMYTQTTEAVTKGLLPEEEQQLKLLNAQLEVQKARLGELNRERMRDNSALLAAEQKQLETQIEQTTFRIDELNQKASETENITKYAATGVDLADAMAMAEANTKELLQFVEKLAIVSPFETKDIEMVTKLGLGAKFSVDFVDDLTKAFLDTAAGVGITSENLAFAADQFFQLKKAGKLTEIDLRQLRRLGIDVGEVLGVKMGMSVEEFNDKVSESPELMDQLFESFVEFSGETFGGAAERMSKTIPGMLSTARDLITVGSRNLFAPLAEALGPSLGNILDQLSSFVTGPQIKMIGSLLGAAISDALKGDFVTAISEIGNIFTLLGASPETVQNITAFLTSLKEEISGFITDLKATVPEASLLIEDAMTRIGVALGLTDENASGAQVAIALLGKAFDAAVIGIQAFAIGMQGLASLIEIVAEAAEKLSVTLKQLQTLGSMGISILGPGSRVGGLSAIEQAALGNYQSGGTVPGPLGAPQLAMVHSGETILPTHQGPMMVTVPVYLNGREIARAVGSVFGQQANQRSGTGANVRL